MPILSALRGDLSHSVLHLLELDMETAFPEDVDLQDNVGVHDLS